MRARLLLLVVVAVTFVQGNVEQALASWTAAGAGTSGARAAVLAPPTELTVTGQSCTPTYSGATTITYHDGAIATGAGTATVSRPSGTVNGDLLVAAFTIRDTAGALTVPTGWTAVRLDLFAGKLQTGIWFRTAAAGDPATWTWSSTAATAGAIAAITAYGGASGVDTSSFSKQTGINILAPSVTPSVAGARLVGVFSDDTNVPVSAATGMTERVQTSTSGSLMTLEVADEALYNATATGSRTATFTGPNKENIGQLVVLTPTVPPTASTISYQGGATNSAAGPVSLTMPNGIVTGDLLLVVVINRKPTPALAKPNGWTEVRVDYYDPTKDTQQGIYYRIATAADVAGASYTWDTPAGTNKSAAALSIYRGVDQASPIIANTGQAAAVATAVTAPSLTPTRTDTRIVAFFGWTDARIGATNAPASGMTSRTSAFASGTGGPDVVIEVEDQPWSASGTATGNRSITLDASSKPVGQMVALKSESYPLASLTWTVSPSTYADGYRLGRSVGGTETVVNQLTPRTLTSYTVGNTNRLTAGVVYDMSLRTKANNWLSQTAATAQFTAMTGC